MSEAEKAVDVEDVLSSIRRLVADGPRSVPKALNPADILTKTAESEQEPEPALETQASASWAEPDQKPANFVDSINASIIEITQDTVTEKEISPESDAPAEKTPLDKNTSQDEDDPSDNADTRAAHIDAFVENETEVTTEMADFIGDTPERPEPFVLRAEMSADVNPVETTTDIAEEPEPVLKEANKAHVEYEATFQDIPEDEMALPEPEDITEQDTAEQAEEEQFIDEDMLREIVGELVRSELQGDLGDRITRNVRKLVRREIHHALATRDFE